MYLIIQPRYVSLFKTVFSLTLKALLYIFVQINSGLFQIN